MYGTTNNNTTALRITGLATYERDRKVVEFIETYDAFQAGSCPALLGQAKPARFDYAEYVAPVHRFESRIVRRMLQFGW